MNEKYLSMLHRDILLIMDEIDRVCKENGLRYYLIGGTLLGAVRHNGFIPWDDDFDIVMPRSDMEELIRIADRVLNSNFYLEWITTNRHYTNIFPKICLHSTVFDEGRFVDSKPRGIFVDIFPLDYTGGYTDSLEIIKRKLLRYHRLSACKQYKVTNIKNAIYRFLGHFISNEYCYKLQREVCVSCKEDTNTFYTNFGSQYSVKRQTMPISWYGDGISLPFEDREYIAPIEYEKVLVSIFGANYLQLPPEEKRRSHYPKKVTFSTGETIVFDEPRHRVKLSEQSE